MARKSRRVEQSKRKQSSPGPSRADRRALAHAENRLVAALEELHEARLRVVRRERKVHALRLRTGGTAAAPALITAPSTAASIAADEPVVAVADILEIDEMAHDVVGGTDEQADTDEPATFDAANARPPSA